MTAYDVTQRRDTYLIARSASEDFGILDGEFNVIERGFKRLDDAIAKVKKLKEDPEVAVSGMWIDEDIPAPEEPEAEDESPEDELLEED